MPPQRFSVLFNRGFGKMSGAAAAGVILRSEVSSKVQINIEKKILIIEYKKCKGVLSNWVDHIVEMVR